jgi:predicted GIY-YIG superfamily endonuclease
VEITVMTMAMFFSVAVFGLLFMTYAIYNESNRYTSELEFVLKQRIIAHNRVKASGAVLKTKYEDLEAVTFKVQAELELYQEKEMKYEEMNSRNEYLEKKNAEIEKLEFEITSIQEMLNGNIKKQLSNYIKEVDGISQRLHRATDEYNENTKSYEFIESKKSA